MHKASRVENQKLLVEWRKNSEQRMAKIEAAIEKKLEVTTEKPEEICETFSRRVTRVEEKASSSKRPLLRK